MWIFSRLPDHALCIVENCVGFPQSCELALYVIGLVCTCLCSPGCLIFCQACVHLMHLTVCPLCRGVCVFLFWLFSPPSLPRGFSPLPEPVVWLGPQSVNSLQAKKLIFLSFMPSKLLLCPIFQDSTTIPWVCLKGTFSVHRNPSCFRTLSLTWGTSSDPKILSLFLFNVSVLSPE